MFNMRLVWRETHKVRKEAVCAAAPNVDQSEGRSYRAPNFDQSERPSYHKSTNMASDYTWAESMNGGPHYLVTSVQNEPSYQPVIIYKRTSDN